ncbi:unnamed protein product [Arctogadus glacialis]
MFLQIVLTICLVGHSALVSANCPPEDYRAGGECCPSCPPGMHVSKDCEERSMTQCRNCTDGTFQPGRNKQKQCSTCTKCDAGLGLKVKKSCTSKSDALCEVLDGFFCSDSNRGGCRAAQRHTVCRPGYYIGQTGTADKDTECLPCANGTFSNGTSSCQPHTICESKELKLMRPGNDSTDSECGEHGSDRTSGRNNNSHTALLCRSLSKKKGIADTDYNLVPTSDGPEPTRDQQEHTIMIPSATMDDDQDDDQSLGPAPPSSSTHNGSVSVSDHQEDHQPVLIKRDSGASRSSLLSQVRSFTSQSASRSYVRSKSVPSYFKIPSPKDPSDRVSLWKGKDVAEEEVTPVHENLDQPECESDDLNSLKPVLIRRDMGVSQVTPLSQVPPATSRSYVRSESVPSHFKVPSFPGTVQKKK